MTTGLFITEDRRKTVDFSAPIWVLPDGLLVPAGNPRRLCGYASIASLGYTRLAVVADQVQHTTARALGVPADCITVYGTYAQAAEAVAVGLVDAFASVARAHRGHLEQVPGAALAVVDVPVSEKEPASGAFAFAKASRALCAAIDRVLASYLGTPAHRALVRRFGFSDADVELLMQIGTTGAPAQPVFTHR